ncbi:hypothetical protein BO94DRAFT_516391 [Aspergillus sclerotioniger CBS 115572]|uniref:Phytase-like domain-containing protein n=1 Tax=Aspergillus sclerotioniger CBS 115572 TaxID=1450535 RepID=A0A317WS89_9EURO|nr:hypothetical protein BO94DRAFT_516391 [Aspergillus sclerotioniger CBS 115572]PWY87997.1 hypothetical protein BO94DRAFT_516391 [Aspergillus sclerotioniger CBS 115572]
MRLHSLLATLPFTAAALTSSNIVNQTTCGNTTYTYVGLEGYGFVPSNATDKYGDTMGGFGSSAAFDLATWRRTGLNSYTGILYTLPDRGWNTNGTLNFQPRIHTFNLTLHLAPNASSSHPSPPNIHLHYLDTLLLTGPDNQPLTGLDASFTGTSSYPNLPPLPIAVYTGDGFGGPGPGGHRIPLDSEGLALPAHDPSHIWICDEYGPYIYKFNKHTGQMVQAIQPPPAYLPRRNSTLSFSADSPPIYNPSLTPSPADPDPGRDNNQGFEALTISPDGRKLYTLLQSALNQEGGLKKTSRNQARLLQYDISSGINATYEHSYVVTLPKYHNPTKDEKVVAAQSEIHLLPTGDFLILARDSGFGHGQSNSLSVYRHADIFHIGSNTTDLKSLTGVDSPNGTIASKKGTLNPGITAAEYCPFLDYNIEDQLARFGLHNGGPQDQWLLNEKWESLALVPVDPDSDSTEYFVFSISDNDFITQDGYMNFGRFRYADASGYNLDNQVLVFRIRF